MPHQMGLRSGPSPAQRMFLETKFHPEWTDAVTRYVSFPHWTSRSDAYNLSRRLMHKGRQYPYPLILSQKWNVLLRGYLLRYPVYVTEREVRAAGGSYDVAMSCKRSDCLAVSTFVFVLRHSCLNITRRCLRSTLCSTISP